MITPETIQPEHFDYEELDAVEAAFSAMIDGEIADTMEETKAANTVDDDFKHMSEEIIEHF